MKKPTDFVEGCRNSVLARQDLTDDITMLIVEELLNAGVVVKMEAPNGYRIYALNKNKIHISLNVSKVTCGLCGINTFVSENNSSFMEGARCIRSKCGGQMHVMDNDAIDYYGRLYSNGDMVRIRAKEHTGLLKRNDREALENEFKQNDSKNIPWKSNLLSCTPTLEMGIDIGDLSTIVLCSVPPTQAQFLQRAGRAGRHDGNSLAVVVANTKPHDLYYYTEPMEMIQGIVEPPKVFLRASAVLERQFVAYCMDSWVRKGLEEKAIPRRIGICLNKLVERPIDIYPFNFLNFVQNNLSSLIRTFIQLFQKSDDGLDEASISDLNLFAKGKGIHESPMHLKILEAFESLNKQRDSIKENIKELKKLKKEKEGLPNDISYEEEIKEIRAEIVGLMNVVRNINNKNIFNFLSDEGLLPNYAFPEAGIQLKAVLYRKEENAEASEKRRKKYQKMLFEYNRSASTALSEFAPANSFYVDGKKLNINKIDLSTAKSAKWRLCPNCSHAEEVTHINDGAACPKCGSLGWADEGQVRTMLRVKMVYSNMPYNKVFINDDSDDRKTVFYCKQMLVDIDEEKDIWKAYQMNNDEFPFGYEFVKKATLREINFGESDITGERMTVGGAEDVRKGFKVCKYCGAIIGNSNREKEKHSFTCRARNGNLNGESYEECLFLYREFETEVLRILVPATTFSLTEKRKESFIAAFMLGMKEFFGNVDHLRATMSEEPIPDVDARKQYLVIYDSVPGGTGYLKQLVQNDHAMIEVLEKALYVLENCPCNDDRLKDGCYHCLYAYRQSYNIGQISRDEAKKVLKQILQGKENVEVIEKLSQIPTNSLFESELERKFISALESIKYNGGTIKTSKTMVNNKEGYSLMVGEAVWEIELQVLLDERFDVSVKSRADFIIWPKKNTGTAKPVVIFTDGFQFHKDKVADDTLKREAIRRSGQFRLWILSWKDVQSVFKALGEYATPTLKPFKYPYGQEMYQKVLDNENVNGFDIAKNSQMELLLNYLEGEEVESIFKTHSKAIAFSLLEPAKMESRLAYEKWESVVRNVVEDIQNETFGYQFMETLIGEWSPGNHREILKMYSAVDIREAQEEIPPVPKVITVLDDREEARTDKYEADWNGFWQFFNIMQFSPDFLAICTNGIEQLTYSLLPIENQKVGTDSLRVDGLNEEWKDIFDFELEVESLEMANKLMNLNSIIPTEIGYELVDEDNEVIAEAEMAWEEQRIVFLISEQDSYIKAFADNGWKVFLADESIPDEILKEVVHNE